MRSSRSLVRRSLRVSAAALVVLSGGIAVGLPPAGQEAGEESSEEFQLPQAYLDGYGWFNKAQQVPTGGKPAPNPPSCPSSPASECGVGPPADGIYVVYDVDAVVPTTVTGPVANVPEVPIGALPQAPSPAPSVSSTPQPLGPSAFGAVRFVVPEGADSQLTLKVLSRSTTTPGGTDPTAGKLFACLVTTPGWLPAQNARYDEGPKYDCTTGAEGDLQADAVTFDVGPQFVQNGMVDVAIVPAGDVPNGGQPFQMALGAPNDDALVILNAADLAEPLLDADFSFEDPALEFEDFSTESFTTEDFSSGETFLGDDSYGSLTRVPVARPSVRAPQVVTPAGSIINPFRPDASRGERLLAVGLLLAIAVALWWIGGQPTRAPRLLGSLGAAQAASATGPAMSPAAHRGIGRFARARPETKAPRLF